MSCPIDWKLRIKRKDGKPISSDEIETIFNNEFWNAFVAEDCFNVLDAEDKEVEAAFTTNSYYAADDIQAELLDITSDRPEYLFQTERDYGTGEYYQNNYRDGMTEVMEGYIAYENPKAVEY